MILFYNKRVFNHKKKIIIEKSICNFFLKLKNVNNTFFPLNYSKKKNSAKQSEEIVSKIKKQLKNNNM